MAVLLQCLRVGAAVVALFGGHAAQATPWAAARVEPDTSAPSAAVDKSLEKGQAALEDGNYRRAVRYFETANKKAGRGFFEAYFGIAQALRCVDDRKASVEAAERALQLASGRREKARASTLVGVVFLEIPTGLIRAASHEDRISIRAAQLARAEERLRFALQVSQGEYKAAAQYLASAYRKMGKWEEARELDHRYGEVEQPSLEREADRTDRVEAVLETTEDEERGFEKEQMPSPASEAGDGKIEVLPPVKVYAPPPAYTSEARQAGVEGVVLIEAVIDREGSVKLAEVREGLHPTLDHEAVKVVKTWKFRPARLNQEPVSVIYMLRVNFYLRPGSRASTESCELIPR